MRILSASEIRQVENNAFGEYFSEAELMKRAGEKCAEKIIHYYGKNIEGKKAGVVCGNGKNAGDGFVISKILKEYGADAFIVLADKKPEIEEPLMYFNQALEAGVKAFEINDCSLNDCVLIVDCIFGIGFHGKARAPFDKVFEAVNSSGAAVVSVDVPSGVNSSDGSVEGNAVRADLTIAVSTLKYSHILPPANGFCGKTVTVNIGIPETCYGKEYPETITKAYVKSVFPKRETNSHKGNFGKQLNICSSLSMTGAGVISAKAALRSGIGLLKCVFPKSCLSAMQSHLTEPLFCPVSENESKTISIGALNTLFEELKWADSVLIGCGLGLNDDTEVVVNQVLKEAKCPVVVDADGINALSQSIDILQDVSRRVVLTPHPLEMGRLIGKNASYVQNNRITVAKTFAKAYKVIVVLKGANTIVTDGEKVLVNTTGNPGMSMGGTGDMLAGMTASFIAQGINEFDAAAAAVYIHGLCGDICRRELSMRGMTVNDMIEILGALMSEFE